MKKRSLKTYLTLLAFLLSFAMLFAILPMQSVAGGEPTETTAADENSGMPAETLPNPDYDPDADPTVTDPPTLEPIGNAGGGDADPMIIDPGIGGGGGIPIGPTNTPLDSGVYTIVNAANQKAVDVRAGGTTAGTVVQQYTDYGSTVNRNQLFKVTYLTSVNGFHYYTIRSMTNSALGLTVDASGVVLDDIGTSDQYANVASSDRWVITVYDTGIYSIQTTNNLGGYLTTGGSTANEHQLSTATSTSTNTRWTFREYEGEAIEGVGWNHIPSILIEGENAVCSAYIYSSTIYRNGPPIYSVRKTDGNIAEYATINSNTGEITALTAGKIQVGVTYSNAPYIWWYDLHIYYHFGTYYLQNTASSKYMQQNSAITTTLEQRSFNPNISQAWVFYGNVDGYFKIKQAGTSNYLTSPAETTVGLLITLETISSNLENRQLWELSYVSGKAYQLNAKIHENTALVLALADGITSEDGLAIHQRTSEILSGNDEWNLIGGDVILSGIPTNIQSNGDHACIPCAITNVAGFWSIIGYSGFQCTTADQQNTRASQVQVEMDARGGHGKNNNIHYGFALFEYTANGVTYTLSSTNRRRDTGDFTIIDIINELDQGRPIMLGFGSTDDTPYNEAHMTVCTGYSLEDDTIYVYLSDALKDNYVKQIFNYQTYNDFICTVLVVSE